MPSASRRINIVWLTPAVLASLVLVPVTASGQQPEKCFLWKVTSKTNTVYVLGTLHLGHSTLYPLAKEIEDAFASSKALAVEVNVEKIDKSRLNELAKKMTNYPEGQSLSKSLSKKTMDLLTKLCTNNKLNVETFERVRPWAICLALAGFMEVPPEGWEQEQGIDNHFLKKALAQKKPILELEAIDSVIWSASLTAELQDALLFKALKDAEDGVKFPWEEMGKAWIRGDIKAAENIALLSDLKRHSNYKGVLEKMYDERNLKMVEKIEGYLKGNETIFVAVGAGHLVGPKGIIRLLQDRKYQLTQVTRAPDSKKNP